MDMNFLYITESMYFQHPGQYGFGVFSRRTCRPITEFITQLHYEANVKSRAVPFTTLHARNV